MQTLKGWTAQRSGANIRVTGFNTSTQKEDKVQVALIAPRRGGQVIATARDGTEYSLVE